MFWLILGYNPARDLTPPQGPEETRLQATAKTGTGDWMIPNLHIGNGCFTKHPFLNGCLGFQDYGRKSKLLGGSNRLSKTNPNHHRAIDFFQLWDP